MDLVKIQFEHPMPRLDIQRPGDWAKVPVYGLDFFEAPLRVVEGLVKSSKKDALVLLTLYSPFMLAGQIGGPETVVRHVTEKPEAFKKGISAVTEGLIGFVKECARLGLDGFYSSTQGGESGRLSEPGAFAQCVRPYDLAVMTEINGGARSISFTSAIITSPTPISPRSRIPRPRGEYQPAAAEGRSPHARWRACSIGHSWAGSSERE